MCSIYLFHRNALLMVFGLAAAALLAVWWFQSTERMGIRSMEREPPPDPRVTFPTIFRNVKPDVAYVGDKACAKCHEEIDRTYHKHPMGCSAALTLNAPVIERYDKSAVNPFTVLERFEIRVEKQPDRVLHHMAATDKDGLKRAEYAIDASLVIGSGTRGRSYLCVRDGSVWQSPVSWFAEKGMWGISPGFSSEAQFQRPIPVRCLYCHTDQVEPIPHSANRFREPIFRTQANIGCERCHGPGQLHVAERLNVPGVDGIDTSIVNPKHLSFELREAVCQQCHLQGETRVVRRGRDFFEYRPGLPLDEFFVVFQRHPNLVDYGKSVGQFEQLAISKCFTASNGKMGCTSCHNPHEAPAPAAKVDYFRGKCVTCHQKPAAECASPFLGRMAKANNCMSCHMTRAESTSIAHVAVTDHRILRNPSAAKPHQAQPIPRGELPLIPFSRGKESRDPAEAERDLGIAFVQVAESIPASQQEVRDLIWMMAEPRLRDAVRRWPNDVLALEAYADVLAAQKRWREALAVHKAIISALPDREFSLARAVESAIMAGDFELAISCATKAVDLNPSSIEHRITRARLRMTLKAWTEAEDDCRAALRENATHSLARVLFAICRHHRGSTMEAEKEMNTALATIRDASQAAFLNNLYRQSIR